MRAIEEAIEQEKINGEIRVVLSDKENAGALVKAEAKGIKNKWIDPKAYSDKDVYEQALLDEIGECDLIVLAGYMRILGEGFIEKAPCPIMNIHPALLPAFPGLHGQRQAVEYGVQDLPDARCRFCRYGIRQRAYYHAGGGRS